MRLSDIPARSRPVIAAALGGAVLGGWLFSLGLRNPTESLARAEPAGPVALEKKGPPRPPTVLTVVTCYPGMTAGTIESEITNRVERWLGQLPGLATSASRSIEGVSMVRLTLQADADPALALGRANALILGLLPNLPPGCPPPLVTAEKAGHERALGFVEIRDPARSEAELLDLARLLVRPGLARLVSLRVPVVLGGKERAVVVYLDRARLQARNLAPAAVTRALRQSEPKAVLAPLNIGDRRFLPSGDSGGRIQDLGLVPIRAKPEGSVFLRDVAVVKDAFQPATSVARVNGRRGVCLPLLASGPEPPTADEIRKTLTRLEKRLPEGAGLVFLPCAPKDEGPAEISIYLRGPTGLRLERMEQRVAKVERFLQKTLPAEERAWVVSEVGVRADSSALYTPNAGPQDAVILIRLAGKRSRSAGEYAGKLRRAFAREKDFADLTARFRSGAVVLSAFDRAALADLGLRLRGGRPAQQEQAAHQLQRRMREVPGAADVQIWQRLDAPGYALEVDVAKAAALGLTAADVYQEVASATGSRPVRDASQAGSLTRHGYPVLVQYPEERDTTLEKLLDSPLILAGGNAPAKLSSVARLQRTTEPVEIHHVDGMRVTDVLIDLEGKDAGALAREAEKVIREQHLPAALTVEVEQLSCASGH